MKPIYQRTGALSGQNGDCFQACLASMFNKRLDDVPNFYDGLDNGKLLPKVNENALRSWLVLMGCSGYAEFGFNMPMQKLLMEMGDRLPGGHYLLTGRTSRCNIHVVICQGGYIRHDPAAAQGQTVLTGPCLDGFYRVGLFILHT